MSTTTTNYGFIKPALTDAPPDITAMNPNWDTIDLKLKSVEDAQSTAGTNLTTHTGSINNPHKVTKSQVGLGNVDNTSDLNKPISTATQTALDGKQPIVTGAATTIVSDNLTANKALISDADGKVGASSVTSTELRYLQGVTANVQTQLNGKQSSLTFDTTPTANSTNPVTSGGIKTALDGKQASITGAATSITGNNLTASRVLVSNSSGKVGVSAVTSTELGYLDGVTSNIQTQLNNKVSSSGGNMTGSITMLNQDAYHVVHKLRTVNGVTYGVNFGCGILGGDGIVAFELRQGTDTTSPQLARLEVGKLGVSYVDETGKRTYLHKTTLASSTTE